jgi:hypothetical protein
LLDWAPGVVASVIARDLLRGAGPKVVGGEST